MKTINILLSSFVVVIAIITTACTNNLEKKASTKPKKEAKTMAFPKHPGTIKMVTMLDNSIEIEPLSEVPERHRFVYYNNKNFKVDNKEEAVRAVPIVEVRMYSKDGDKLVPKDKASVIWIEMYDSDGNIIDTHTMWRDGIRGGKRKTK